MYLLVAIAGDAEVPSLVADWPRLDWRADGQARVQADPLSNSSATLSRTIQ
jgi:hypothetical protein